MGIGLAVLDNSDIGGRVLVILPESLIGFFIKRGSQYELILESLCSSR